MPIYEYRCEGCGKQFEVMQKFADQPLTTHDECGGNVHRLLSAPALQFKGSGWYVNDYAKGGKTGRDSSTGGSSTKTEPSSKSGSSEGSTPTDSGNSSAKPASTPASDTK